MSEQQKRKRGGQAKYAGETPVRTSVSLRPRYRKAIELIQEYRRDDTLTEALEFAISYMALRYQIDDKALASYVCPEQEYLNKLLCSIHCSALIDGSKFKNRLLEHMNKLMSEFETTPTSLIHPEQKYTIEVWQCLDEAIQNMAHAYFTEDVVMQVIHEGWKAAYTVDELSAQITDAAMLAFLLHQRLNAGNNGIRQAEIYHCINGDSIELYDLDNEEKNRLLETYQDTLDTYLQGIQLELQEYL